MWFDKIESRNRLINTENKLRLAGGREDGQSG